LPESFLISVALEGTAIFLRIKHSLSSEVASEATSLPGIARGKISITLEKLVAGD